MKHEMQYEEYKLGYNVMLFRTPLELRKLYPPTDTLFLGQHRVKMASNMNSCCISVDRDISLSILDEFESIIIEDTTNNITRESFIADANQLFLNIPTIRRFLDRVVAKGLSVSEINEHHIILITLVPYKAIPEGSHWWAVLSGPNYEGLIVNRNNLSNLIGYDVADNYFLSSIFNCGLAKMSANEKDLWLGYLNDSGLFTDLSKAIEFSNRSNELVAEHSPFNVFGIYKIGSLIELV